MKWITITIMLALAGCYASEEPPVTVMEDDPLMLSEHMPEYYAIAQEDVEIVQLESTAVATATVAVETPQPPLCIDESGCVEWCISVGNEGGRCFRYLEDGTCDCPSIRSSCECL